MGDRGATNYAYSGETTEWEVSVFPSNPPPPYPTTPERATAEA